MKKIPLSRGLFTLVDDEDYKYLNQWKWTALKGDKGGKILFYAYRVDYSGERPKPVMMHRLIMQTPIGEQPDHRDNDGLNNQRYNLRNCTHKQNHGNQRPCIRKLSKYKGVSRHLGVGNWFAQITVGGKRFYKGGFKQEVEAALFYDKMAKELFGEFAYLNFPDQMRAVNE